MPRILSTCLFLCLAAGIDAQLKPLCFAPPTTYTYGGSMINHVTSDFNGDGFVDLAGGNLGNDQVMIYLNDQSGHFTFFAQYPTQYIPQDLVAADLNNDQKTDLLVVNSLSASVSIFFGNGNGSFQVQPTFTVHSLPKTLACADFNSDGNADLVVNCGTPGKMMVFMGSGTGTFQAPTTFTTKTTLEALGTGDFNGDGNIDIANTVVGYNELNIFYGNGNGTFQAPVTNYHHYNDYTSRALEVADFNNDTYDDIVLMDDWTFKITLFKGAPGTTLSPYQTIGTGSPGLNYKGLGAGDINDDGFTDLITPWCQFYLGHGNGLFTLSNTYTTPAGYSVIIDDLNHDRKPDLVLAGVPVSSSNSSFLVALNGPTLGVTGLAPYLCAGFSPTLEASGAGSYSWSTGQQTSTMTATFSANATLTVYGYTTSGCANSKTIAVIVKPTPDPATLASMNLLLNHYGPFCKGDEVRMCVTGATGFTWSTGAPNQPCIQHFPQATHQLTVVAMNAGGCKKEIHQNLIVQECVGLEEEQPGSRLQVYPNPALDHIILESEWACRFDLHDGVGRLVMTGLLHAGKNVICTEGLEAGWYTIRTGSGARAKIVVDR